MRIHTYIYILILFFLLTACNEKKKDLYIISEKLAQIDSLKSQKKNLDVKITNLNPTNSFVPPPPIDITEYPLTLSLNGFFPISGFPVNNFYLRLVFILDSTNLVHLYQTEVVQLDSERAKRKRLDDELAPSEPPFSDFIGLKPEHLLTFKSSDLMSFIEENSLIFELDTLNYKRRKAFVVASTKDTISNPFFYDLVNLVSQKENSGSTVMGLVRMTSEEENEVIKHKKNKIPYEPKNINWSSNFLDGQCKPFSARYDSIKKEENYKIIAIPTIKKLGEEIIYIL